MTYCMEKHMENSKAFAEEKRFGRRRGTQGYLDCVAVVFKEKIESHGEDSFCFSIREKMTMLGVFDGCGGSGAKVYPAFDGKSGAYMASRVTAGTVRNWFKQEYRSDSDTTARTSSLKNAISAGLAVCKQNCGMSGAAKMKGSLSKEFPTTAAVAICEADTDGISADIFWAGDSRVYLLDSHGLAQLTADDLSGEIDAYENLSSDGVLTNVINASSDFDIHCRRVLLDAPCVVLCASDGCFGYIPSPMEFEYMLLDALDGSTSVAEWEYALSCRLADISGDDYTLVAGLFGYDSFPAVKASFRCRKESVYHNYIEPMESEAVSADELWRDYRESYYRLS